MHRWTSLLVALVLAASMTASATTPVSPALQRLALFVGVWHVEGKLRERDGREVKTSGTTDVDWALNDHWLRLDSRASAAGQPPYAVIVFVGWNDAMRKYQAVAINSEQSLPVVYTGEWVSDRLTFTGSVGRMIQRVAYEVRPGDIGFSAENSLDGGKTYMPHASAVWRLAKHRQATP